ncbi:cytochrome P450 4C1 [Nilaparvata lugens]|uniref:Cytochrome P450 n=1 Tax=Nilaparvata lugens TaxID=108931 RepID=A0A109NZE5_NILLU|nr:cytochrome P450 4C1 [Nilaparvata lugens]XP_039296215.1 cytochrome P450 4C1 [Nilaparvata lugens]ALB34570.1 cytochrome P450 [Nilaparvata lugens]
MFTWVLRLILIGIILLLVYLRYRKSRKRLLELGAKLPGPPSLPLFGNMLPFAMRPDDCIDIGMKFCTEYDSGPIRFWFLNELIVFVAKPQDAEILLSNMKHLRKPWQYKLLKPFMGEGLFTNSDNSIWRLHRKMITPAFHFSILKGFLPIFFEEAKIFASKIPCGEEVDVFPRFGLCALDIICRTAMGVHVHSQEGKGKEFVEGMETLLQIAHWRLVRPYMINDTIFSMLPIKKKHDEAQKNVFKFTESVIQDKRQKLNSQKSKCNNNNNNNNDEKNDDNKYFLSGERAMPFLDLMMAMDTDEMSLTDEQLRDEAITIIIGGQETTTTELTFTLLMLAIHHNVQAKVLDEIDLVFGSDLNHTPTIEDLQKLEYLERVLKEVMRLYPSIPYFARVLEEEVTLSNNYTLPKECIVCIFNYGLHRHPESFPNPERFDPDNFLPERCRGRSPFAFVPFSAGPRNCIGQKYAMLQMKTVVSTIFRHFRVTPGKRFQNGAPIRIKATTTIKCSNSVDIVFHRR